MLTLFTNHWKKWLIVVVLGAMVVVAFDPVMNRARTWRAGRLLEDAREFAAAENWREVQRAALASAQLLPSLDAIRLIFQAQRQNRDSGMLRTALALALQPDATMDDRVTVLGTFLDAGDLIGFAGVFQTLNEEARDDRMVIFQRVRFHLMRGELETAVVLADAVETSERLPAFDLLLARTLVQSPRPEVRGDAFRRIELLLENSDRSIALDAMRILASQPDKGIHSKLAEKALARFRGDKDLGVPEQLALRMFELGIAPDKRDSLTKSTIADYKAEHLDDLLRWLLRIGAAEDVIELTKGVKMTLELFQHRCTAQRVLKRYDQLASELNDPPAGIPPVDLYAARAAVARLQGKSSEEAEFWRQAFSFAKLRPSENQYFRIAETAGQVGAKEEEMEALARAIEHPQGIPPTADRLSALIEWLVKNDTERLLKICQKLLQREPGNPMLVNNYHYLSALYRKPDEQALPILKKLVKAFPEAVPFRGTLALVQLKSDDAEGAIATLDVVKDAPGSLPDGEKAVYAGALFAEGKKGEADDLAKGIRWELMDKGESGAFRKLMGSGG